MKFVIIGGTGLIGSKLVASLRAHGHDVIAAAPNTGVNTLTGEGLAEALAGAAVVVDVSNSPSFDDAPALEFFVTSTRRLLDAEVAAGVRHHVALSVVGTDRLLSNGYFRAKMAQETLIGAASVPHTVVRATQFFEFIGKLADAATDGRTVRLPPLFFQPMAAEDVATMLAATALGDPANGIVEIAGPQQFRFDALIQRALGARNDPREVITDTRAPYWGIAGVDARALLPGDGARLGEIRFDDWLAGPANPPMPRPMPQAASAALASARGNVGADPRVAVR